MNAPSPQLGVDDSTPLARRALALLQLSRGLSLQVAKAVPHGRLLLVNAERGALTHALSLGTRHIVHVREALDGPGKLGGPGALPEGWAVSQLSAQLYQESLLPRLALALASGRFVSAAPLRRAAYVAEEDVTMVAAVLLAADHEQAQTHLLTGPRALSHRDVCELAAGAWGRRIVVEQVALPELQHVLEERGLSPHEARVSAESDAALLSASSEVTQQVAACTGMASLALSSLLTRQRSQLTERAQQLPRPATRRGQVIQLPTLSGGPVAQISAGAPHSY